MLGEEPGLGQALGRRVDGGYLEALLDEPHGVAAGAAGKVQSRGAGWEQGEALLRGKKKGVGLGPVHVEPGKRGRLPYTLNELPQPQVDFTLGFSNLKPAPSSVST